MSAPLEIDRSDWYLDEDDGMGEARLHRAIIRLLLACIEDLAEQRGWTDCVVDSDQFFSWVPGEPGIRVAPDVYLVRNAPADPWVDSWQTWKPGHEPPAFALEVVSQNWRKDYELAAAKYAELGVEELVIFDPWPESRPSDRGLAFRHYRREQGVLQRRLTAENAVLSRVLGAWIVAVRTDDGMRLRLASPTITDLLPTPVERLVDDLDASRQREALERAAKEDERAAKEEERAAKEEERAAKERERAAKEEERAAKERERAAKERLEARLRALGIDPDSDE